MAEKQKEASSKSSLGSSAFWTLVSFGICYLIYQEVIKPAQKAEESLANALPPLIFKLSRTAELCSALKDPTLSPNQKEGIINILKDVNQGMADVQAEFELSINKAGRALDKEILKLDVLGSRVPKQYVSIISILGTKDNCPSDILIKEKLEQLQKDILNRYPRTWLGILLFKLGLYRLESIDTGKYF